QGNYQEAAKLYQQSMEIEKELRNKSGIAGTLHQLGMIHQDQGNYQEAAKLYQQSMEIEKELRNKSGIATTLHQLGMIHQHQGNYQEAAKLYQQSMEIEKELGNKSGIANTLGQLGRLHEEQDKDYTSALEKYMRAYLIFKELQAPEAELAQKDMARIKENIGEDAFKAAIEEIRRRNDDI
ncbi:MAG: tetratricopeptide repeat protein, partial [Candidatus Omnitrophica bacterium]|nr:tetratricopeptide repeat protein [Candidatus Omnitrophota bacterium]